MKKIFKSTLLFFFVTLSLSAQNYTISGYITDSGSSETLISASVYENNSQRGTVSNSYGFYSLTLPAGNVDIDFSYVGYHTKQKSFKLHKDTTINISLNPNTVLNEVTVTGSASNNNIGARGTQMSAIEVPVTLIKKVPTIFGENDVLKVLQLLPGVQGGVEGSAGFYVRGGGPDENLFLLDGIPVYNVNHLGGMFSVFNADAIKNVTLYKGSFPARFGGRLSSVLDIRMYDGNNKKLKGNVSIGLISSKFNLEGPLFSDKTTFNISARRTYYDILAQPALAIAAKNDDMLEKLRAGYY
nr:carboxypeptidase-like regulatory domain-containing protein [Paludibacter sp.]